MYVTEAGSLDASDLAVATGAHVTTVRAWLRGGQAPSARYAERIAELSFIVGRLAHVLRPDAIGPWLRTPNAAMARRAPAELVAHGNFRTVSRAVAALEGTPIS